MTPTLQTLEIGNVKLRTQRRGTSKTPSPERYSFDDVGAAFSDALGNAVAVKTRERHEWETTFKKAGFSDKAAHSYARMTEVSLKGFEMPEHSIRGETALQSYISNLVKVQGANV